MSKSDMLLNSVFLNPDLILCDDVNCINAIDGCIKAIDVMYLSIMDCIVEVGENVMHECNTHDN